MKKKLAIFLILTIGIIFQTNKVYCTSIVDERDFEMELRANKGNREKSKEIYSDYIKDSFSKLKFEKSIELIEKLTNEFPESNYVDDYLWFKNYINKYFLHNYNDLADGYVNLIEKYGKVEIDEFIFKDWNKLAENLGMTFDEFRNKGKTHEEIKNYPSTVINKETLEVELKEIKDSLDKIKVLEKQAEGEQNKEKILKIYKKTGKIWRSFYDYKNAEKIYKKGAEILGEDVRGAELLFEIGEMYKNYYEDIQKLPFNHSLLKKEHLEYKTEQNKKAIENYIYVYKSYPKSPLAPKALNLAGELYTRGEMKIDYTGKRSGRRKGPVLYNEPIDSAKGAELYEKIWKEYPGWEGIKGVLQKVKNAFFSDKQNRKISEIDYLKEMLEIDKVLYKEDYEKKYPDLPILAKREELIRKAEIYKELYGKDPNIEQIGLYPKLLEKIKELDELIQKKQSEKGGGSK